MKVYVYRDDEYLRGIDRNSPNVNTEIPDELYQRYLSWRKQTEELQEELKKYSSEG